LKTVPVSTAGDELINTTAAEVPSVVPSRLVANVPLSERDLFDLTALARGVGSTKSYHRTYRFRSEISKVRSECRDD
jgi:hypothetical protein